MEAWSPSSVCACSIEQTSFHFPAAQFGTARGKNDSRGPAEPESEISRPLAFCFLTHGHICALVCCLLLTLSSTSFHNDFIRATEDFYSEKHQVLSANRSIAMRIVAFLVFFYHRKSSVTISALGWCFSARSDFIAFKMANEVFVHDTRTAWTNCISKQLKLLFFFFSRYSYCLSVLLTYKEINSYIFIYIYITLYIWSILL